MKKKMYIAILQEYKSFAATDVNISEKIIICNYTDLFPLTCRSGTIISKTRQRPVVKKFLGVSLEILVSFK